MRPRFFVQRLMDAYQSRRGTITEVKLRAADPPEAV